MNTWNWYGVNITIKNNETSNALEDLLSLYITAISYYLQIDSPKNVEELIQRALGINFKAGDILFIQWFAKKGLRNIHNVLLGQLPNNEILATGFQFDKYVLEQEMGERTQDLRSYLVDIVNNLPERISEANYPNWRGRTESKNCKTFSAK